MRRIRRRGCTFRWREALAQIADLSGWDRGIAQNCRSLSELLELVNATNCVSLEHISPQSVLFFGGSILFANCIKLREYSNTMERDLLSMATHADKEIWRSIYDQQYPNVQVPSALFFLEVEYGIGSSIVEKGM